MPASGFTLVDDASWLDERLTGWAERGFDGPLLATHLAGESGNLSEAVLRLEKNIERSEWLVKQVEKFPLAWTERAEMLDSLSDPNAIEANERRWRELVRSRRPWHAIAEKFEIRWSREGRTQELADWLERLDRVDPSMIPQAGELLSALENAVLREDMEAVVADLEGRQNRRVRVLEEMVFHLRDERGWTLSGLSGNLQERYAEVGRIQDLDSILLAIEEITSSDISIYDREAASALLQRAELAQNMEEGGRLAELQERAEGMASDYETRLQIITDWLADLDERQLHLNTPRPPAPGDLLVLESRVDEVADAVVRLGTAWLRLDALLDLFPDEAGGAAALQGQVERVDDIEGLVEILQARRDENDSRARGRLQGWVASGFEVEPFEVLLEQRPRVGWLAIEEHAERVGVCKQILSNIDLLDVSYAGAKEAADWSERLRTAGVNYDDVADVQEGMRKRLKRNGLHRQQLDEVRVRFAGSWPARLSPGSLSLSEYEEAIKALQAGKRVLGHFGEPRSSARESRLVEATRGEVDLWRTSGWDVSGLDKMFERAPSELWASLPAIRGAMDGFNHLKERLQRLPLRRSSELLDRIGSDLRRPERLQNISDSLPSLAAELAALPETADEREFALFEPTLPEPFAKLRLVKELPILIPRKVQPIEEESRAEPHTPTKMEPPPQVTEVVAVEPISPMPPAEVEFEVSTKQEPVLESGDIRWDSLVLRIGGKLDAQPRDLRVQRLARLMMLLEPQESDSESESQIKSKLTARLDKIAGELEKWTRLRLVHRNTSTDGSLLRLSARLASRLYDIPGPGTELPIQDDEERLPDGADLKGMEEAVSRLEDSARVPYAGGKPALVAIG